MKKKTKRLIAIASIALFCTLAGMANAQDGDPGPAVSLMGFDVDINALGEVLLVFLVISVVFETAMTPIFNWRVFLTHFESKGIKTPVVIVTAFFVFWSYDLDIVEEILRAMGHEQKSEFGGRVLTALLVAGGSDGVFRIFDKLGIRNSKARLEKAAEARAAIQTAKRS